jgi:hypothetical protein
MAISRLTLGLALATVLFMGCGNPDMTCDTPTAAITADKVYSDVIKTQCLACHGTTPGDAKARMAGDYATKDIFVSSVVGVASPGYAPLKMVDTSKKLDNSTVWLKLLGDNTAGAGGKLTGPRMPEGGMLTAVQLKLVKDWICSGAP